MNKIVKKIGIVIIVSISLFVLVNTNIVSAADDYVAVSGISQVEEAANADDLEGMIGLFFSYAIGIAVVLAVFFIIYGAVLYMTTDAFSQKSEGKEKIISAIGGLILALISWLILHEINPELVQVNFGNELERQQNTSNVKAEETERLVNSFRNRFFGN